MDRAARGSQWRSRRPGRAVVSPRGSPGGGARRSCPSWPLVPGQPPGLARSGPRSGRRRLAAGGAGCPADRHAVGGGRSPHAVWPPAGAALRRAPHALGGGRLLGGHRSAVAGRADCGAAARQHDRLRLAAAAAGRPDAGGLRRARVLDCPERPPRRRRRDHSAQHLRARRHRRHVATTARARRRLRPLPRSGARQSLLRHRHRAEVSSAAAHRRPEHRDADHHRHGAAGRLPPVAAGLRRPAGERHGLHRGRARSRRGRHRHQGVEGQVRSWPRMPCCHRSTCSRRSHASAARVRKAARRSESASRSSCRSSVAKPRATP